MKLKQIKKKKKKVGDRQTRNYSVTSEVYLLVGALVKTSGKLDVFKKKKRKNVEGKMQRRGGGDGGRLEMAGSR